MGQLGHIDTHHLSKYVIRGEVQKLYVVAVLDDYSRLAWAELLEQADSLSVMFSVMRCFMELKKLYNIQFEEVLTDNGKEFGGSNLKHKQKHAFERMLIEMGVKHRYTQFYRPQTNGKIERFWRTMEEDLIMDTDFDSKEELKEEILKYNFYYNEHRPHQGIEGKKPIEMINRSA
ncbi:MAG: integrase core domain-containing protein [Chitinophagaceae bacterium]